MIHDNPQNESNNSEAWYQTADPREHTYSPGYGFSDKPPHMLERAVLSSYAAGIGVSILGFFVLRSIIPTIATLVTTMFFSISATTDKQSYEVAHQAALLISSIAAIGIPFNLFRMFIKIPAPNAYPFKPVKRHTIAKMVFIGLGVSVVSYSATVILVAIASLIGVDLAPSTITTPTSPAAIFLFIINTTVIPAFFEEMAFRGVVMQTLRRFGDGFALITSSLLFAIIHANFSQTPNAIIMGLVMGYFTMLTGSLWPAIAIHFTNNLSVILMLFATQAMSPPAALIVQYVLYMVYIIAGVVSLLYLLRRYHNLFYIRKSCCHLDSARKVAIFFASPAIVIVLGTAITIALGQLGRF